MSSLLNNLLMERERGEVAETGAGQRLRVLAQVLLDLTDLYIGQPQPLRPTQTGDKGRGQIIAHVLQLLKIARNANGGVVQTPPAVHLTGNTITMAFCKFNTNKDKELDKVNSANL